MNITYGVHALVWTGGWSPEEARRAVSASAAAGYDLIELAPIDPTGFDAAMTAGLLAEYGLAGQGTAMLPDAAALARRLGLPA